MRIQATVTEVELDDGTIYTPPPFVGAIDPGNRLAGDMHVPWLSAGDTTIYHGYANALAETFALRRVNADGTVDDISPVAGMGVNHYGFAIRAHDSNAAYMLAAVAGGGEQAVYISDDNGDSWTAVVAPAAGAEPYRAAFGGDSEEIIYIWGPSEYMGYSDDMGVTVDDRSGNLSILGASALVGIAGGPTG